MPPRKKKGLLFGLLTVLILVIVIGAIRSGSRENLDTTPDGCTIPAALTWQTRQYGEGSAIESIYGTPSNIMTLQRCANRCCANAQCQSYSHYGNLSGACHLHNTQREPQDTETPNVSTGIVTRGSNAPNLDTTPAGCTIPAPEVGYDRYGNNIRTVQNIATSQQCANLCCAETGCQSYTHYDDGRCFLKTGQATPVRSPLPRSDMRTGIVTKGSYTPGAAWSGEITYSSGNTVTYGGVTYTAVAGSINQTPSSTSTYWRDPNTTPWLQPNSTYTAGETWSDRRSYVAGNIVTLGGVTYKALSDNDGQDPATSTYRLTYWRVFTPYTPGAAWSATTDYAAGNKATLGGVTYKALRDNTNENPTTSSTYWRVSTPYTAGAPWLATTDYDAGNKATLGGVTYTAILDNTDENPATSRTYWRVTTPYTAGAAWLATTDYLTGNTATLGGMTYTALLDNTNENPATTPRYWRISTTNESAAAAEKAKKEKEEADAKKKKEDEETMLYIGIGVAAVLVVGVLAVSMSR